MLKPLTAKGRHKCGIDKLVGPNVFVYVALSNRQKNGPPYVLGAVVAGDRGYFPIPEHWVHADSFDELDKHAVELNRAMGMDPPAVDKIVAASMRPNTARKFG